MIVPIRSRLGLDNKASHFKPLVITWTTLDQSNNMIGTFDIRGGLTAPTWRFTDQLWSTLLLDKAKKSVF